jgi:hypothetical protein
LVLVTSDPPHMLPSRCPLSCDYCVTDPDAVKDVILLLRSKKLTMSGVNAVLDRIVSVMPCCSRVLFASRDALIDYFARDLPCGSEHDLQGLGGFMIPTYREPKRPLSLCELCGKVPPHCGCLLHAAGDVVTGTPLSPLPLPVVLRCGLNVFPWMAPSPIARSFRWCW